MKPSLRFASLLVARIKQSLHLLNGKEIQDKIASASGRAAAIAKDTARSHDERMRELYLVVFGREPNSSELETAVSYLKRNEENQQLGYEDILWALINTKEFQFNH